MKIGIDLGGSHIGIGLIDDEKNIIEKFEKDFSEDEKKNIIDSLYGTNIAESKSFWITVFNDLKDRGLEKVLYVVSDALTGIEDAIFDFVDNNGITLDMDQLDKIEEDILMTAKSIF